MKRFWHIEPGDSSALAVRRAIIALAILVPLPAIVAFAGLEYPKGIIGKSIYAGGKVFIVIFPVFWLLVVERGKLSLSRPRKGGMAAGALTGVVMAALIVVGFLILLDPLIDPQEVQELAEERGLAARWLFLLMALFWIIVNPAIEEYVWRWFVFTHCRTVSARLGLSAWYAVAASALFFTLHHIVAIGALFDWHITAIACTGVFVAGVTWSWLYNRYESIWPPYLSHLIADVPIFIIGQYLIFG